MPLVTDKIFSSFQRLFDQAAPADVSKLRKISISANQRETLLGILADLDELERMRSDFTFPSRRLAVLTQLHAGKNGKLDDLPDDVRRGVERAAIEGDPREILHQDELIAERGHPVVNRARLALEDCHRTLVPAIQAEINKVEQILRPVFSAYGCEAEVPDCGPIRQLSRSLADSQRIAAGDWVFTGGHLRSAFAEWL